MTEARSLTPFLLYLPLQTDIEKVVSEKIKQTFPVTNSQEIIWVNQDNIPISIEMVRNIQHMLSFGSSKATHRHLILLRINTASTEAQNALLKILEEPPANTQFWLTCDSSGLVLPTIISRCQEVTLFNQENFTISPETIDVVERLGNTSYRELSDIAESYADRERAQTFLNETMYHYHHQLSDQPAKYSKLIQAVLQAQKYLDANVNVRLVLENFFFVAKKIDLH